MFSKHTYIVLAWIMMLSQWTSLSGSFGRLLKDLAACRASWADAASPPPPCQLKTTHRPDSLPRTRSTEVICTRKMNQKSNHMPADHRPLSTTSQWGPSRLRSPRHVQDGKEQNPLTLGRCSLYLGHPSNVKICTDVVYRCYYSYDA